MTDYWGNYGIAIEIAGLWFLQEMGALRPMAKIKRRLSAFNRRQVQLTAEQFESLKAVGTKPIQRSIPDKHREHLIAAGYIREVAARSGDISALALTGRGIRRLSLGK